MRRLGSRAAPLAIPLATVLSGCGGGSSAAADIGRALPTVSVRTALVTREALPVTVAATGTITARPGSTAALGAPAAARITRVFVAPGDRVRRGDPLVAFDRAPFQAAFDQAQAAQQSARQAYDRADRLAAQGILPRRDVEQARAALAQTAASLVVARRALERSTLRSPITGVVARSTAVLDASADPAQPLVEVVDPTALEVRMLLAPGDAGRVQRGAPVTFSAGTAGGEVVGTGRVVAVAAAVDSLTGAVAARAQVTQSVQILRLGEVVRAVVQAGTRPDALVVPVAALVPSAAGDGYQLFVVTLGDTARARQVTVGIRTDRVAEVVTGVSAGEVVVAEGAYGVEDGSRVTPQGPPATVPASPSTGSSVP